MFRISSSGIYRQETLDIPICLTQVEPPPSTGSFSLFINRVESRFNCPYPTTETQYWYHIPDAASAMVGMATAALQAHSCHPISTRWANLWAVQSYGEARAPLLPLNMRNKNSGGPETEDKIVERKKRRCPSHLCMKSWFTLNSKDEINWNQRANTCRTSRGWG